MAAELLVLYTQPQDPQAFERHFNDRHLPLVEKLPGLLNWRRSLFVAAADMLEHTYHGSTTLEFDDAVAIARDGVRRGQADRQRFSDLRPAELTDLHRPPDARKSLTGPSLDPSAVVIP